MYAIVPYAGHEPGSPILGTIVNDGQIPARVRLLTDRSDRFAKIGEAVVRGDDDGDQRRRAVTHADRPPCASLLDRYLMFVREAGRE